MTRKYKYTVYSMEYDSRNPRKAQPTGRIVRRPTQVLFDPRLSLFGLREDEANHIRRMPAEMPYVDHHGDIWECIA